MSFIFFDHKNVSSLDIPEAAAAHMIAKIDRDYPQYVSAIPCIYDVVSRHSYNGRDECIEYLSSFAVTETPVETVTVDVADEAKKDTPVDEPSSLEEPEQEPSIEVGGKDEPVASLEQDIKLAADPPKKKATRRRKIAVPVDTRAI